jgi:membrane protease YdiL (CAAX protease family)
MGAYLGGLWQTSGNLLVPIVAHAVYDFAVLCVLLRRERS